MTAPPAAVVNEGGSSLRWYVYDRHAELMHIADSLTEAEAWAFSHWDVVEVGDREQIAEHDFFYLLLAKLDEDAFRSRDFQVRITREDRVAAIGRDTEATPRHP
jgi:hypothetical protein